MSLDVENFLPIFFGQMNESKYYIYKKAKEIAMNDMIKLRQRFCKDCDIPVNIFDEPYFSDRLKLFDFLYNSVSKWDLFKSELAKYDSAIDYFTDYSRIKDEAIETVRSTEGFQLFTAYGINDFSIKNKGLPASKIYNLSLIHI